jgi:hypothetical protein
MAGNSTKKRTRCPNGTRKNPKTGKCEANTSRKANNAKANNAKANNAKANNAKANNAKANNAKANNAKANNAKANKVYKYRVKAQPSAKSRKQKKTMQNQFMLLSKTYQAYKAEQTVKRGLAKKIMANNLQRTKLSLKKKN